MSKFSLLFYSVSGCVAFDLPSSPSTRRLAHIMYNRVWRVFDFVELKGRTCRYICYELRFKSLSTLPKKKKERERENERESLVEASVREWRIKTIRSRSNPDVGALSSFFLIAPPPTHTLSIHLSRWLDSENIE